MGFWIAGECDINCGRSFLVADEDVIELPAEVGFAPDGFLNDLIELGDVLVHQCCGIVVEGFLQIGSLDVLHQMQQSHADLIELVDGLPS